MRIAFLGLGKMGRALARLLIDKGHEVTVWNRSPQAADGFERRAATPAEAVRAAELAFTMVTDDAALEAVLGGGGVFDALPRGAVHASMSTISVALAERLEAEHARRGQRYLGCPVFGRPNVAAEGKLWLAVAGEPALVAELEPVFRDISRGFSIVGERPSQAHALKLGGNFMIASMVAALAEGFTYADSIGIAPELFLEAINSALFQSPFYANYGGIMLHPAPQAAATIALGAKDTGLFREASGAPTPLADLIAVHFKTAIEQGKAQKDWAGGYLELLREQAEGARV